MKKSKKSSRLKLSGWFLLFMMACPKSYATDPSPPTVTPQELDWEWKKSEALESLLNQKLEKMIVGSGISQTRFRSNVVVLFHETLPAKIEKKPSAPPSLPTDLKKESLDFPELLANPTDIDSLMAKYKYESAESKMTPFWDLKPVPATDIQATGIPKYLVSFVNMAVTVDPLVSPERIKELEQQINSSFSPAFGSQLNVQVKSAAIIDPPEPTFLEKLEKFQKLALGLIALLSALMLMLLWKLLPNPRDSRQLDMNRKEEKEESEEIPPATPPAEHPVTEYPPEEQEQTLLTPTLDRTLSEWLKEAVRLEKEIVDMVKGNPALSRMILEDFLRFDFDLQDGKPSPSTHTAMLRVALFLEALARSKIQCEKLKVKEEIFREFQKIRSEISEISPQTKVQCLGEVYWTLVSFSFLKNGEQSFPPFYFLEGLEDMKVAKLLRSETPAMQALVFLGMSEKKSARVLQAIPPSIRQSVFEQMCSGNIPESAEMEALVKRIQEKSAPLFADETIPSSPEEGISAIALILQQLDFKAQFESVKTLFSSAPELRRQLKSQVFFIGLLPESKPEYLANLLRGRTIEWIKVVLAGFDESFKQRTLELLPSMQREILESADLSQIPNSTRLVLLQELQSEIRLLIEKNDLTLGEIFELSEKENVNVNHEPLPFPKAA